MPTLSPADLTEHDFEVRRRSVRFVHASARMLPDGRQPVEEHCWNGQRWMTVAYALPPVERVAPATSVATSKIAPLTQSATPTNAFAKAFATALERYPVNHAPPLPPRPVPFAGRYQTEGRRARALGAQYRVRLGGDVFALARELGYTVAIVPAAEVARHARGPANGVCIHATRTAFVSRELSPSEQRRVIAHELGHAYFKHPTASGHDDYRQVEAESFGRAYIGMS